MRTYIIITLIVLSGFLVNAQEKLSLMDAISTALENNYDMQIVRQDEDIAKIRNNWGNAGRFPYINLSAENRNASNQNDNDDYSMSAFSAGANLSWTLFDGFSVKFNKERLVQLEELSKQNTAIMVEGTIQSVVLAYYAVLLEKEKLDVYEKVMNLSLDLYKKEEHKKEFGSSVTYNVLQAQNAYLADKSSYLVQEVAYKNAIRDLKFLLAVETNVDYELDSDFIAIPKDYSLADLSAEMQENNKSLRNQYINQNLLKNAVALAKSEFSPSLSFAGGAALNHNRYNYDTAGEVTNNNTNFYGNFTLSFNLFSGGNRKRALQIARIEEEVGKIELTQMSKELSNSLANAFEFYLVRKELLNVANENMQAAELNLQISKEKFETGAINSFNFRDIQNLYLNAAVRKLEATYNFIDIHTSLLRIAGTIVQEYPQ